MKTLNVISFCIVLILILICCGKESNDKFDNFEIPVETRIWECFANGKLIEEGTSDWDKYCGDEAEGKWCCLVSGHQNDCCLYKLAAPQPEKFTPHGSYDTFPGPLDTLEVFVTFGDTSWTFTLGSN